MYTKCAQNVHILWLRFIKKNEVVFKLDELNRIKLE